MVLSGIIVFFHFDGHRLLGMTPTLGLDIGSVFRIACTMLLKLPGGRPELIWYLTSFAI